MVWVRWGLLLSFGLFLSPVCDSVERQQSRSGFRRVYVLQPGPGPGPGSAPGEGGARVSSISTRHGQSGQPLAYNVELTGNLGSQVRIRRMGNPAAEASQQQEQNHQNQLMKLSGVNVCGGQCCHGWSKTQGSQRCTKPNCLPPCQNGGMCLRPHLCVCKPGSQGKACEQTAVPAHSNPVVPGSEPTNGHTNSHTNGNNVVPQRPIPQQVSPNVFTSSNNLAQMKLTVKAAPQFLRPHYIQQHIQQQIRPVPMHPGQSQQYVIKPKYYHTHTTHTQMHVQPQPERPIPLTVAHNSIHAALGNQTGRIKVVFTPTICKVTCIGSRCHNNCEKGNTTTIISENGHTTDTLTAPNFRVVVCHLPCINGGKCSARDKCQCPPNFAGKFCQMPIHNGHQQHQQSSVAYGQAQIVSTHTLPLTNSHGQTPVFNPGIVNIHIKHPPEASVQVHQVSQLDNYSNNGHQQQRSHSGSSSSSSYSYHHSESSQKIQQHGYNIIHPNEHGHKVPHYQPITSKNTLGRCFQETAAGQCGKALPGLTKLEQCCATIGTSWGFHKCQTCPNKPSIPLIDCPLGYKRVNSSHCQDVDECQLQGVCPNGDCLNTVGSYMCTCKPGYVPDSTLTSCIPRFKEICPGGMGYTILPNPPVNKPVTVFQEPDDLQPLPTPEEPDEDIMTQEAILPEVVERTSPPAPVEILPSNAGQDIAPTQLAEVDECQINPYICGRGICYNTVESYTCHCDEGYHLNDHQTTCVDIDECENGTVCPSGICFNEPGGHSCGSCPDGFVGQGGHCMDIDECHDERVCIRGLCLNTEGSFLCQCGPGFRLSSTGDQCDDVDECQEEMAPCQAVGECVNNMGSYTCTCPGGYRQIDGTSCIDVDECLEETELCSPHGTCLNTKGSYLCVCDTGFTASLDAPSCDDIDECGLNETRCGPHGYCENRLGSFQCLCDQGYQESQDGQACEDANECDLLSSVCGEAECLNVEGSFLCVCPKDQDYNVMIAKCEPTQTGPLVERKDCYYHLSDENLCESVLSSLVTLQECCCTLGAGWGDNCEVYPCPVYGTDHFRQMCPSGRGFIPNEDLLYGITFPDNYKDADECKLFEKEVCKGGYCGNTEGSYECYCESGHYYDPMKLECKDVNECLDESICDGGECLNTNGSYICFCKPPMVLDPNSYRCIVLPHLAEQQEMEQEYYQGICWQTVSETNICTQPLGPNRKTTFTECCCRFGEGWGMDCALCPARHSEDYASMCNIPLGGRRQPYGHDALVAGPVHEYEVSPGYLPSPDEEQFRNLYENEEHRNSAFEGLQAEECGILNGCENGRCVRVQEGYTCDCFAGYTLDLSRMSCIDVNECSELNTRMSLCKNGKCINTVGSYQCECLPGYRVSDKPNYCVKADEHQTSTHIQ
ncbi:latent-transforming growth factor beta-binding protein 1 isoform X3 [Girardinichthys multiradiatus]|uniref:latent-transforming growth factor beta-binding protein 1 isoform X3 n=1 Tax=Girardinichthys multiradiatus TaxID=208333 RepID=UPI001FAD59B0|nr:latent-transforming growth factor beta-binding protein 1 isoform X3 [Girardinichthys multiradiatus]